MALLEARGLTKTFGSVTAAANINVAVNEREVIGIIGANGAGKTTFVNMVTGYLKPSQGSIWFNGQEITPFSPREITRMGICRSFQVPQVFMSLSLFDNLLISLGIAERSNPSFWRPLRQPHLVEAAEQIVVRYNVQQYRDQQVALLPQGVRKLLDIAMAMAHHPRIVLLDEPTSGVSVSEKFGIMDVVMGALRETGVTVMFIEHDMEIIERYGSRVIAFAEGTVIADGSPKQVLEDAQVRRLVIGEELHREEAPMLKVQGLVVNIGTANILRDANLEVRPGAMCGLIGRNGAGKTTFMRSVMGALPAQAGRIDLGDTNLHKVPAHQRAHLGIGYMPEDRRLVPEFTTEENVLLPAWSTEMPGAQERLQWIYKLMPEVKNFAGRPATQLSGGQQKLVALARALMCGSKLLMLDEPFEGVAPALARRLAEVISDLKREGLSVLLAESNERHVADLLDAIYVIERGSIQPRK